MGPILGGAPPSHMRVAIQGQSNSHGYGPRSDIATLTGDPGLMTLDASAFNRVYIWNPVSASYEKMQNGVNALAGADSIGPEFGLAVRWMRETKRGNLYIDKTTYDAQPIASFRTGSTLAFTQDDAGETRNFWAVALSRVNAANAWLAARNIRPKNMGMLWVQGESDNTQSEAYYTSQLTSFLADRLASGMQSSTALTLLVQMFPGTGLYSTAIAAAKTAVAAANPSTVKTFVMANYLIGDNVHSNGRGQIQTGYDAFEMLFNKPHLAT